MNLVALRATAWDGQRVWLTEEGGHLLGVDGDSGEVVVDRQLDAFIDSDHMVVADRELWAIGQDSDDLDIQVLRIDTGTGKVDVSEVEAGRPLGQVRRRGPMLVAADFDRRIATVDPQTGATRVLVDLDVIPNFVEFAPDDTFWVVDDNRARILRVGASGNVLVDSPRRPRKQATTIVAALVADQTGNAWLAERTAVTALNPAGETIREVGGFKNATVVLACEDAVVASDVETGELAWLNAAGRDQRVETGRPGLAIACAPGGVWFVTNDGYLARVPGPTR